MQPKGLGGKRDRGANGNLFTVKQNFDGKRNDHQNPEQAELVSQSVQGEMTVFDIDTGNSGSGSSGPWINWHSKESNDGAIPGRSFSLRDQDGRKVFKGFDNGVIFDIDNMKLGWNHSTGAAGAAPEWQWNPSISQFAAQPAQSGSEGFQFQSLRRKATRLFGNKLRQVPFRVLKTLCLLCVTAKARNCQW